jgi:mRNA interferase RelE/StbE
MRLTLLPIAERELANLSPDVTRRLTAAIEALVDDPRPPGCRLLRDRVPRTWRIRVGDWRVLYGIDDAASMVTILRVLHRSRAY